MTALLELKQKIKNLYGEYDIYILPALKFVLALTYFVWINMNMGYMTQLDNVFVVLILSLVCCILPLSVTVFAGYMLILGHSYALSPEAAAFMLVLILFMALLFLRFSSGRNSIMIYTPLAFGFNVPVLLPIGGGLLSDSLAALPAGCGVILYYFIRFLKAQEQVLASPDVVLLEKVKLLADGLVQNWPMWITVVAFVAVTLIVHLIRTRSFDYAWRIAIIAGGVTYVLVMFVGSVFFNVTVLVVPLMIYTLLSVLIGFVLEFVAFGGDYSRTERMQYEDDEYYYYVKAVPKALVATSERSIKKITADSEKPERKKKADAVVRYQKSVNAEEKPQTKQEGSIPPVVQKPEMEDIDFEKRLEESLRDL